MFESRVSHCEGVRVGSVLLVDDDSEILGSYGAALRAAGFSVVPVSSVSAAHQEIDARSFDIVMSDIGLVGANGIDVLRAVRKRDSELPVLLMTAGDDVDTAIEAVAFGATRYLQKPLSLDGLQHAALDALHRGQTAKLRRQALDRYEHEVLHERELGVKFARALETLYLEYQPIIRLSERRIVAYEALVRSREPALCTPHDLLAAAEELDATFAVGRAVRSQVAALIRASGIERVLVNLHAQDLNDDELFLPTSALSAVAAQVVLEITDRAALDCIEDIGSKLQKLRDLGFGIGLDGLGAGYAGLGSLVQLCPDVIKLDVSLIQDLDRQPLKRRLVQGMITLGKEIGVEVIAEGVETFAERDALCALGCDLYQGYLFAKPSRTLLPSDGLCGLGSRA